MSFEELIDPSALIFLSEAMCTLTRMPYVPRRVAFVDETIRDDRQLGHFYIMTATILDKAHPDYGAFWRELRRVAWLQPSHDLHASKVALSPNGQQDLNAVERAIGESNAVRAIAVVRARIAHKGDEIARQRCIASLLTALSSFDIRNITLDTRDHLGQASKSITSPRLGPRNALDAATIQDLQLSGELPPDLYVCHGDDQMVHELWVPDVTAYAVGRALADHNPARLQWLAPHLNIREARILPVSERTVLDQKSTPITSLTFYLDTFTSQAKAIHDRKSGLTDG